MHANGGNMGWGKSYNPYEHAELLGADVIKSRDVQGFGDYRAGVIRIHPDLTQAEARCTIAHEIVHHEHRDDILGYCGVAWLDNRLECDVHAIAARRLIIPTELADAAKWAYNPNEIAEQLVVDTRTLYVWLLGLTAADYADLRAMATDAVRRSVDDLRAHAERAIGRP